MRTCVATIVALLVLCVISAEAASKHPTGDRELTWWKAFVKEDTSASGADDSDSVKIGDTGAGGAKVFTYQKSTTKTDGSTASTKGVAVATKNRASTASGVTSSGTGSAGSKTKAKTGHLKA